jgi:hypothetical protein
MTRSPFTRYVNLDPIETPSGEIDGEVVLHRNPLPLCHNAQPISRRNWNAIVVVPSANPANLARFYSRWARAGWMVLAIVEPNHEPQSGKDCDFQVVRSGQYSFARLANQGIRIALRDPYCELIAVAGDDMDPLQPVGAPIGGPYQDIGALASDVIRLPIGPRNCDPGIYQPTGDSFGETKGICGSPIFNRAAAVGLRADAGCGPYYDIYRHLYCDRELFDIASKRKILKVDATMMHYHHHWSRHGFPRPAYLNHVQDYAFHDQGIYQSRKGKLFSFIERYNVKMDNERRAAITRGLVMQATLYPSLQG